MLLNAWQISDDHEANWNIRVLDKESVVVAQGARTNNSLDSFQLRDNVEVHLKASTLSNVIRDRIYESLGS